MDMRDFGSGFSVNPNRDVRRTDIPSRSADVPRPSHQSRRADAESTNLVRSPEWIELAARLSELPAVRSEAIQVAQERLAAGYYATRAAALQAASAILGA